MPQRIFCEYLHSSNNLNVESKGKVVTVFFLLSSCLMNEDIETCASVSC